MENLPGSSGPVGSKRAGSYLAVKPAVPLYRRQERLRVSLSAHGVFHVHWHGAVHLVTEMNTAETKERNLCHSACRHWTKAAIRDHPCLLWSDSGHSAVLSPTSLTSPPFSGSSPTGETKKRDLLSPGSCSLLHCECQGLPNSTSHPSPDAQAETESWDGQSHVSYGERRQASGTSQQRGILF